MSTVISVLTPSKIGVWNIPMRGQNFINNYYANLYSHKISLIHQEGFLFKNFDSLKTVIKKTKSKKIIIIFCSNLQLSNLKSGKKKFINFFKKYEIHFVLELQKGKGSEYLKKNLYEIKKFSGKKNIEVNNNTSYQKLFRKYKNQII